MKNSRIVDSLAFLLILPLTIFTGGVSAADISQSPAPSVTVRAAYTPGIAPQLPILAAERLGLFRKYGVKVELLPVGDFGSTFTAFVGQKADTMLAGPDQIISVNVNSPRFRGVLSVLNNTLISLIAKPGITSVQDLKGKTGVAATSNDIRVILTSRYLKSRGMNVTDVNWLAAGTPAGLLAALLADRADFTVLPAPQLFVAEQKGFRVLVPGSGFGEYPTLELAFSADYIKQNREAVRRVVEAVAEAQTILKANRERGLPILTELLNSQDAVLVGKTYDWLAPNLDPGCVSLKGLKLVQEDVVVQSPQAANVSLALTVDESFVREIAARNGAIISTKHCGT